MAPNDGQWLALAAALLLLWFITVGAIVQLQQEFDDYKTHAEARYHALEDTPGPPPSYWEGLM